MTVLKDFPDLYYHEACGKWFVFLEALCRNVAFPPLNAAVSSVFPLASPRGDVLCWKHQPLPDRRHHCLPCLSVPSLGLQSKPPVLITTLLKPFHSGDEHPLRAVNKQVGYFHEASSQKLIASQNWLLLTVNSNYCTEGFLSLSHIQFKSSFSTKASFVLMCL